MIDKVKLLEYWNQVNKRSINDIKESLELNSPAYLEFLLDSVNDAETFEIGVFESRRQKGSVLTYDDKNSGNRLELRLKIKGTYELVLILLDMNEDEVLLKHKLSSEEIQLIPQNIKKLMEAVREINQPLTFYNN